MSHSKNTACVTSFEVFCITGHVLTHPHNVFREHRVPDYDILANSSTVSAASFGMHCVYASTPIQQLLLSLPAHQTDRLHVTQVFQCLKHRPKADM